MTSGDDATGLMSPPAAVAAAAIALAGALLLVFPARAPAATTLGSDLTVTPNAGTVCSVTPPPSTCTFTQTVLPGRQVTAPVDGVIVRWRVRQTFSGDFGPMALTVLRQVSGTTFTAVRSSSVADPPNVTSTPVSHVFETRLPIAAGEFAGIHLYDNCCMDVSEVGGSGAAVLRWVPILSDGSTDAGSPVADSEYLFNADVEPDADADGFGDETQDQCPSDASTHGSCPEQPSPSDADPPETTIASGPPDKTKKKSATFEVTSNEPASTFECRLDDDFGFGPCNSPVTVKVDKGKHTFQVRAMDAAGNVDPTPASDGWRVKKKRKR